jgi:hypothetical protein
MIKLRAESPRSSSPTSRLCETHARFLNPSFSTAVSQASSQIQKPLGRVEQPKFRKTQRLAENCVSYRRIRTTGNGNVDKAVVKCLRVEEKLFVARNKTNGMAFLIYRWLQYITFFKFDARLVDTQETYSRTS